MIITSVIRSIDPEKNNKSIDYLFLEWYETSKRIQRVTTEKGKEIALRFMGTTMRLKDGDVLFEDSNEVIVVRIKPCNAICVSPKDPTEMAKLCFELGNKHLPIFLQEGKVFLPFEQSTYNWLSKTEYQTQEALAVLSNQANPDMGLYYRQKAYSKKDLTIKIKQ